MSCSLHYFMESFLTWSKRSLFSSVSEDLAQLRTVQWSSEPLRGFVEAPGLVFEETRLCPVRPVGSPATCYWPQKPLSLRPGFAGSSFDFSPQRGRFGLVLVLPGLPAVLQFAFGPPARSVGWTPHLSADCSGAP